MTELRQCAGFAREALNEVCVPRNLRRQNLERDHSLKPALTRFVNGAHTTRAQQTEYLELRKQADQQIRARRRETKTRVFIPGLGNSQCFHLPRSRSVGVNLKVS